MNFANVGKVISSIAPLSIAIGAGFTLIEMIAASHQRYWVGGTGEAWRETGLAFIFFFAMIALPSGCAAGIVGITRKRVSDTAGPLVVCGISLVFWLVVRTQLPDPESPIWVVVPVALVLLFAIHWFFASRVSTTRLRLPIALIVIFASTIAALAINGQALAFDDFGAQIALRHALIWLAVLATFAAVWMLIDIRLGFRPVVFFVGIAAVASVYPLSFSVERVGARFASAETLPNVLMVTIDTLRADYTSAYGGDASTPTLDEFAESGVLFERCYSLSPWTIPSMAGLFTSRYPPGLTPNAPHAQRQQEGLSYAALSAYWRDADGLTFIDRVPKNYRTVAINGNPTLDSQRWLLDRFDQYVLVDALNDKQPKYLRHASVLRGLLARIWPALNDVRLVDTTALITEYAEGFLHTRKQEPFFLWVHYMDPHGPYNPPKQFRRKTTPWESFPPGKIFAAKAAAELPENDRSAARSLYKGEIEYVDACLGELLHELHASGSDDETLVVLSSDHGESLWDHMGWGHAYDLYDEQIRVPLLFSGPGIEPGRFASPVSAIDVLPTLAEFMGMKSQPEWRGRSLLHALRNGTESLAPLPCFAQATSFAPYNPEPQRMIVDGDWKLIHGLETDEQRLFDLSADPQERTNLANSHPEELDRLSKLLSTWHASFPDSFAAFPAFQPEEVEEDFVETMRALGYIAE